MAQGPLLGRSGGQLPRYCSRPDGTRHRPNRCYAFEPAAYDRQCAQCDNREAEASSEFSGPGLDTDHQNVLAPIVTLTMNPAIDLSCMAESVSPTHKIRTFDEQLDPGGGGINVARV